MHDLIKCLLVHCLGNSSSTTKQTHSRGSQSVMSVSCALLFITGLTQYRLEVCLSLGSGEAGPFIAAAGLSTLEVLPCQMQA